MLCTFFSFSWYFVIQSIDLVADLEIYIRYFLALKQWMTGCNGNHTYSETKMGSLCTDQLRTSTSSPPPPPPTGIWTFEDWIIQIPTLSGQNGVQMPYHVVGFVCLSPTFEDLFWKPTAHKCYISSFKLFHLIQTHVLWLLASLASEKK